MIISTTTSTVISLEVMVFIRSFIAKQVALSILWNYHNNCSLKDEGTLFFKLHQQVTWMRIEQWAAWPKPAPGWHQWHSGCILLARFSTPYSMGPVDAKSNSLDDGFDSKD